MATNLTRADRILGCLLGGALGDAIGAYYEGRQCSSFKIPSDLRVTDDTQLTLATCEAIVESQRVTPESIASHLLRWFRQRRLSGIGSSTLKALAELDVGGHWALVGATGEYSAGNGAAMRIAPLAFLLDPDVESERTTIRDVCRITHRNDEAYLGALAILRSIRHAAMGSPLAELPNLLVHSLPDSRIRDRLLTVRDGSGSIADYASQFGATGYVVDSAPLAVLGAIQTRDVLATIEQFVIAGGDTDTIASMCGQILGAAMGPDSLPAELIEQIDLAPMVHELGDQLARVPQVRRTE